MIHKRRMFVKFPVVLSTILFISIALTGCGATEQKSESKVEVPVQISVQRTGNILTGIGDLSVLIDDEDVFQVSNNSTESVEIIMTEGIHTIQTKGQGDKSKKIEFEVINNDDGKKFYFTTEISNWWGIKLEKKKYIPTNQ